MPAHRFYPLFLDVDRRPVLIVGGGAVALRKARGLLEAGARVTIVSPQFAAGLAQLASVERIAAPYAATHMARKSWRLVFAATDRPEVNALVHQHAGAAGLWCCRCDLPEQGDFASGATQRICPPKKSPGPISHEADRAEVVMAVSTSGASPGLAARICRQAAAAIDPVMLALVHLTARWRAAIKAQVAPGPLRRELLEWISGAQMETTLRSGGETAAEEQFRRRLSKIPATAANPSPPKKPTIAAPHATPRRSPRAIKHAHK